MIKIKLTSNNLSIIKKYEFETIRHMFLLIANHDNDCGDRNGMPWFKHTCKLLTQWYRLSRTLKWFPLHTLDVLSEELEASHVTRLSFLFLGGGGGGIGNALASRMHIPTLITVDRILFNIHCLEQSCSLPVESIVRHPRGQLLLCKKLWIIQDTMFMPYQVSKMVSWFF